MNAILAEVREAQARGMKTVSLMRGEPDMPTPPHIVEACVKALRDGRTGYPDNRGEPGFREAVAAKLQGFDPGTQILATSGATFGIYAALTAILAEGGEVLLPDPIYDAYHSPIVLAGGVVRAVPARIVKGRFTLDVEALERAWTPAVKALIVNNPWNPVGTVLTAEELKAIGEFCDRRGIVVISDEIYEAIVYPAGPVARVPAARCVIVNSLSKTYCMTGWRVGYCAGPADLIARMYKVLAQSSRGPATFIQDAAAAALTGPQDCVETMRQEYARRRDQVLKAFPAIAMPPEGGFFSMFDLRDRAESSDAMRRRLLNDHGVVVVHGAAYGSCAEGTLRVSFASGGEVLREGLSRLAAGLA